MPSPTNPPPACRFHTRCPKVAGALLRREEPLLEPKEGGGVAACHFPLTDAEVAERVPTAQPSDCASGGLGVAAVLAVVLVERLARELAAAAVEDADLEVGRGGSRPGR